MIAISYEQNKAETNNKKIEHKKTYHNLILGVGIVGTKARAMPHFLLANSYH